MDVVVARLAGWLAGEGVTQVAMEATGVYWRPVWAALEEELDGVEVLLVNAQHVKNLRARYNNVADGELGGDYFDRRDTSAEIRRHVAAPQRLGQNVTINPAA